MRTSTHQRFLVFELLRESLIRLECSSVQCATCSMDTEGKSYLFIFLLRMEATWRNGGMEDINKVTHKSLLFSSFYNLKKSFRDGKIQWKRIF